MEKMNIEALKQKAEKMKKSNNLLSRKMGEVLEMKIKMVESKKVEE